MAEKKRTLAQKRKQTRIYAILGMMVVLSLGAFLVFRAFEENILRQEPLRHDLPEQRQRRLPRRQEMVFAGVLAPRRVGAECSDRIE